MMPIITVRSKNKKSDWLWEQSTLKSDDDAMCVLYKSYSCWDVLGSGKWNDRLIPQVWFSYTVFLFLCYRHSLTHLKVIFWMVQHKLSWVFIWSVMCVMFKGVHLKSILQHTGIWSATVWGCTTCVVTWQCLLPHSCHCTFILARENLACSSKKLFSFLFTFLKTGINWNHTIWGVSVLCMFWNLK